MELLDLPSELLEHIIGYLVTTIGPLYASEYRLVCKYFAVEVQSEILARQPLIAYSDHERKVTGACEKHMAAVIDGVRFEKLFARHGGTIICNEVLQRQNYPLPIVTYLRELTECMLKLNGAETNDLRRQYTKDICTALSGVYWKQLRWRLFLRDYSEVRPPSIKDDLPPALAAVGNITKLMERGNKSLLKEGSCLPSPMQAASANGRVDVLFYIWSRMLLRWPMEKSLHDHHLRKALIAAIRKNQILFAEQIGHMYESNHGHSIYAYYPRGTVLKHADVDFVRWILSQRTSAPPGLKSYHIKNSNLSIDEARYLLHEGSRSVLRGLLQDGTFDPHYLGTTTPLNYTISLHRYDLAAVLLEHGVPVDGLPGAGQAPLTPLWHAVSAGFRGFGTNLLPGVRFLLQHGANPDIHGPIYWECPSHVAARSWLDVHYLLQEVKKHGVDTALSRVETWDRIRELQREKTIIDLEQDWCEGIAEEEERGYGYME